MPHAPFSAPSIGRGDPAGALPSFLTSLVGRERELEAIHAELLRPGVRLLTLVGPGGAGKTRLAVQAAEEAAEAFDAVLFIDFSTLTDPALALGMVARALGVVEAGHLPTLERIGVAAGERRLLLLFDNLEHIVEAAPELSGVLVVCPAAKILSTSRVALRVRGEREFLVPPLSRDEAMTLFEERAQAVRPAFELSAENSATVSAVCRELDDLPLAIELAAARAKVLSPESVLTRLEHRLALLTGGPRDAPGRQRSLRDAIAWSHDLLDDEDRQRFRQLAVFAGGFDVSAAERVLRIDSDFPGEVLDGLAGLVDKSLVRVIEMSGDGASSARFGLLETVRAFAQEQLAASVDDAETRDRHAGWCLEVAAQAGNALAGPDAMEWVARLDTELPNLNAGLSWLIECERADDALQLATSIWLFWLMRGRLNEGRLWLERALAVPGEATAARARAIGVAGLLAANQADYSVAGFVLGGLDLAIATGDQIAEGLVQFALGDLTGDQNEHATAIGHLERALELFEHIGDASYMTPVLVDLGAVHRRRGDDERATYYLARAVELARAHDFELALTFALNLLSRALRRRGDVAVARAMFRESLDLAWRLQNHLSIPYVLLDGAKLAAEAGEPVRAVRLFAASGAARQAIGMPREPSLAHATGVDYDRTLAQLRAELGEAQFGSAWEAGRAMSMAEAVEEAGREGATPVAVAPVKTVAPATLPYGLTPRELEVLRLLTLGNSDRDIGETLFISPRTAQVHVARIIAKLEVANRAAAAVIAVREGLVTPVA